MPKVYLSKREKYKRECAVFVTNCMRRSGLTTSDMGDLWGISQQGAAYRIRNGNVTLADLMEAQKSLGITVDDFDYLLKRYKNI